MRHSMLCLCFLLPCLLLSGCPKPPAGGDSKLHPSQPGQARAAVDAEAPPAGSNHLWREKSLYLQQHVSNPVDWYPWGQPAFDKAKAEKKFIFVSIGYSSCHWCHVMEEEVFSQADVAAYMNSNYVCIKVDREERPDIDATYMEALQHVNTGSGGGWPLNMWLTADLKPITGSTYLPKDDFLKISERLINTNINNPADVSDRSEKIAAEIAQARETGAAGTIDAGLLTRAAAEAMQHADKQWGGMQSPEKFPLPTLDEFLLQYYRRTGDAEVQKWLKLTLDRMADGGMYDHVGGGFHRYCTDQQWVVPHFEKMLSDNAQLAVLYTDAAQSLHDPHYAAVARGTLDFMLDQLSSPSGGFYASVDARSGGVEGASFVWTKQELLDAGGADGPALAAVLGVTDTPNFKDTLGKISASVLTRRAPDPHGLFEKYRPALATLRAKRTQPTVDQKVVAAWNGMALSACARGYTAFGNAAYLERAEATADFLWKTHHKPDGSLFRASNSGTPDTAGVLEDYADLARGLLDLYEASGKQQYLQNALELLSYARTNFANPAGGFFDTPATTDSPLGRLTSLHDGVEPSGASALLLALLQAGSLTGDNSLFTAAEDGLKGAAGTLLTESSQMPGWLQAVQLDLGPYYDVVIAGDPAAEDTKALLAAYRGVSPLNAVLLTVPATGPDAAQLPAQPALEGKLAVQGKATAYVCMRGACQLPTQDPAQLKQQLTAEWKH